MNQSKESLKTSPARSSRERLYSLAMRLGVWGAFFCLLFILRSFFLLLFLTFVFSYLQAQGVQVIQPRIKNRTLSTIVVALFFLGLLVGIISYLGPRVKDQATLFANKYPEYLQAIDKELLKLRASYPLVLGFLPEAEGGAAPNSWDVNKSAATALLQQVLGFSAAEEGDGKLNHALALLRDFGQNVVAITSAFLLSLLFSFLIVLDLPRLTESVRGLSETKIGFIYHEVAGNIRDFGSILGRALAAQLFIALANTMLTAILLTLLGLGSKLAFLSIIVFLCSFIPVAGVFFSSIPICLMALQEHGLTMMFLAIGAIWIIHLTEAYVLNPRIFGHHLHLNPVLVLVILTIAGKLFHVWGLVLGVPVCTYFFGHAIRYQPKQQEDQAVVVL